MEMILLVTKMTHRFSIARWVEWAMWIYCVFRVRVGRLSSTGSELPTYHLVNIQILAYMRLFVHSKLYFSKLDRCRYL